MTIVNSREGTSRRLALDWLTPSTRQNSLLTDISVLYTRRVGGWLPTAAYVRLLADLDVPDATARTGLHRMTKGGFLVREARDGRPGYRMSTDWVDFIAEADVDYDEIFYGPPSSLADGWTLVSFSVPEERRADRHVLRSVLSRRGYAAVSPGLWILPGDQSKRFVQLVERLGYEEYVDVFTAAHVGTRDVPTLVQSCWDVAAVAAGYDKFLATHQPAVTRARRGSPDPRTSFVDLTTVHNAWRSLFERDPGLPVDVLPRDWPGLRARQLLRELLERSHEPALSYVRGVAGR